MARRGVPYSTTVGVPVTVQPGAVTELYPDKDGSPASAPGFTSRFGLSTRTAAAGTGPTSGVLLKMVRSVSRRTQASTAHSSDCVGLRGPVASIGASAVSTSCEATLTKMWGRSCTVGAGGAEASTAADTVVSTSADAGATSERRAGASATAATLGVCDCWPTDPWIVRQQIGWIVRPRRRREIRRLRRRPVG